MKRFGAVAAIAAASMTFISGAIASPLATYSGSFSEPTDPFQYCVGVFCPQLNGAQALFGPLAPGGYTLQITSDQPLTQLEVGEPVELSNTFYGDDGSYQGGDEEQFVLTDQILNVPASDDPKKFRIAFVLPSGLASQYYPDGHIEISEDTLFGQTSVTLPDFDNGAFQIELFAGVPEPVIWMELLAGMTLVGWAMRRGNPLPASRSETLSAQ